MGRYSEGLDQEGWAVELKKGGFVPDPMIPGTADSFAAGGPAVRRQGSDGEKRAAETWDVIHRNVDGLIAFFDLLLTAAHRSIADLGDYPDLMVDCCVRADAASHRKRFTNLAPPIVDRRRERRGGGTIRFLSNRVRSVVPRPRTCSRVEGCP